VDKVRLKIVGFACNERTDRDTNWMVQYSLKAIEKFGRRINGIVDIETEFIDLADKKIRHCLNCDERWEIAGSGRPWGTAGVPEGYKGCIIKNDWLGKEWWPRIPEVDGYIFGARLSSLVCTTKFRLLTERYVAGGIRYASGNTVTNAPVGLIAVGDAPMVGQENCMINMTTICKALEMIEVSCMMGVSASITPVSDSSLGEELGKGPGVKVDEHSKRMAVYSARRVAEFAIMQKIAKIELGDLYDKEFIHMYHAPRPEGPWAWYRLDKEDEEYMMNL
jgi:multimeric flavodoxin WrbA